MSVNVKEHILISKQLHFSAARYEYHKDDALDVIDSFAFGANYHLWVGVKGPIDFKTGLVVEINLLREKIKKIIDTQLDHVCFEKKFQNKCSLIELGNWLWKQLKLACDGMQLSWLKLYEGPYWIYEKSELNGPSHSFSGILRTHLFEEIKQLDFFYPIRCESRLLLTSPATFKKNLKSLKPLLNSLLLNKKHNNHTLPKDYEALLSEMGSFSVEGPLYTLEFRPFGLLLCFNYDLCLQHRLTIASLSIEENKKLFGPCVRLHGHNLKVELSIHHSIELDLIVLLNQYNKAHKQFKRLQSRLNQFCEDQKIKSSMPLSCEYLLNWLLDQDELKALSLARVRIYETPRNMFQWENPKFCAFL